MSVGYNLDGIKQPPMQEFIDNMMDASAHPKFAQYRDTLNRWLQNRTFIDSLPARAKTGWTIWLSACRPGWFRASPSQPCTAARRTRSKPSAAIC
jgi:hypothetical protein